MSTSEQNCKWTFAESLGGQDIGPNDALVEFFRKIRQILPNSLK